MSFTIPLPEPDAEIAALLGPDFKMPDPFSISLPDFEMPPIPDFAALPPPPMFTLAATPVPEAVVPQPTANPVL